VKIETVLRRRNASNVGFQKYMLVGLCDKSEDCHNRPCQHARLPSGQRAHDRTPSIESRLDTATAVKEVVEAFAQRARSAIDPYGIAQCHLLERKEQIRARLDSDRSSRNFVEAPRMQQRSKL
jgi:hypothetical protein